MDEYTARLYDLVERFEWQVKYTPDKEKLLLKLAETRHLKGGV
jgi:hypothetical protein